MALSVFTGTVDFVDQQPATLTYIVTYTDCDGVEKTIEKTVTFIAPNPPNLTARFDGNGLLVSDWHIDETAQSVKIAGSPTVFPDEAEVDAKDSLNGATGTTSPLTAGAATPGSTGWVAGEAFRGLDGSGRKSALAFAQVEFPAGGITPGDFLGEVCHIQTMFSELGGYFEIVDLPSALTDLADIWGKTQGSHFQKVIGAGKNRVRLQRTLDGSGVGTIALQYFDGSDWRYLDGVSGPMVELSTADLLAGGWVPIEDAAAGDREIRPVVLGGDGATDVVGTWLGIEWCTAPVNTPDDPTTGDSSGDCTIVGSNGLEYTSVASMESDGWTMSGESAVPGAGFAWQFPTSGVHGGSRFLRGVISRNAGFPGGTNYAKKTFTGLTPLAWHTVTVWAKQDVLETWDSFTRLAANGTESPSRLSAAGEWQQLILSVLSTAGGNVEVELRRVVPQLNISQFAIFDYDDIQVQEGLDCAAGTGCTQVASDDFEYADIAAMEAAGWVKNVPTYGSMAMDTSYFKSGTKSLHMAVTYPFGGAGGYLSIEKTFTGLTPDTDFTGKVWCRIRSTFYWFGNAESIGLSGTFTSDRVLTADTWEQLKVVGASNSLGELTVRIQVHIPLAGINYTTNYYWDKLQIFEGGDC